MDNQCFECCSHVYYYPVSIDKNGGKPSLNDSGGSSAITDCTFTLNGEDCEDFYSTSYTFNNTYSGSNHAKSFTSNFLIEENTYEQIVECSSMNPIGQDQEKIYIYDIYLDGCDIKFRRHCIENNYFYTYPNCETVSTTNSSTITSTFTLCESACDIPTGCMTSNTMLFTWLDVDDSEIETLASSTISTTYTPVTCESIALDKILSKLETQINGCIDEKVENAVEAYQDACLVPENISHTLSVYYPLKYNHYTLYYYGRAGNLLKTVPPKGVDIDNSRDRLDHPEHTYETKYEYNSLGQLVSKKSPDEDDYTDYYYNSIGQLRYSQNAKQKVEDHVSYTKYDRLGRVIETGELETGGAYTVNSLTLNVDDMDYVNGATKTVFTSTSYTIASNLPRPYHTFTQRFLVNRVSSAYRDEDGDPSTTFDRNATYYSYDPHGNVEWVIQEVSLQASSSFAGFQHLVSKTDYEYDLISGNVLKVSYNHNRPDPFYQKYHYDPDNRIKEVESSRDNEIWDSDARYSYYDHGPLQRIELGDDFLQGLDYVYTVNGWLKSINSTEHERTFDRFDPGNDQKPTSKYVHDQFGMQLGYHENDYYSDSGDEYMNSNEPNHLFSKPASNLYNGNISNWEISYHKDLVDATGGEVKHRFGNTYRYDVLGRLTSNTFYEADQNSNSYTTGFTRPTNADYSTIMNYDPNGNFNNLERRGPANSGGTDAAMDNVEYYYETGNNRLNYATDYVGKSFTTDLGIQHPGNYSYTELGELEYDLSESSTITWTPDGKVRRIDLGDGNYTAIEFYYDARGDRVAKIGRSSSTNSPVDSYTIYHRDAAGNVLAIYDNTNGEQEGEEEWLCVEFKGECYWVTDQTRTVCFAPDKWYEDGDKVVLEDFYLEHPLCPPSPGYYNSVTFSKALMDDIGGDPALPAPTKIASYHKEVRFKSGFSEEVNLAEWHLYGSSAQGRVATVKPDGIEYANTLEESATFGYLVRELSEKYYEVKDHLGNIRLVFSDMKKVEPGPTRKPYALDLTAVNNYYPFGMLMPENNWQSGLSRYGFNGHENDNEVKGTGNHIAFGDYGYDTRLGRRWNQDPIDKPWEGSYTTFNNNPINRVDPDGLNAKSVKNENTYEEGSTYWKKTTQKVLSKDGKTYEYLTVYEETDLVYYKGDAITKDRYEEIVRNAVEHAYDEGFEWEDYGVNLDNASKYSLELIYDIGNELYGSRDFGPDGKTNPWRNYERGDEPLLHIYLLFEGGGSVLSFARRAALKTSFRFGTKKVAQEASKFFRFAGDEAIVHYTKHGKSIMNALGEKSYNLTNYLIDANYVIRNGTFVPEFNGYVRLIGGQGNAKYAFVGLNRTTGNITTFHIKTAKELSKKAPSLGIGY